MAGPPRLPRGLREVVRLRARRAHLFFEVLPVLAVVAAGDVVEAEQAPSPVTRFFEGGRVSQTLFDST